MLDASRRRLFLFGGRRAKGRRTGSRKCLGTGVARDRTAGFQITESLGVRQSVRFSVWRSTLPAVLPAASGLPAVFLTRWDLFGSPAWPMEALEQPRA